MKKIELVKGIQSSIIGFGCAPILGAEGAYKSKRALECAIDYGVNHFDLARSYGYGESERFVGKILGAKRKDMVLASKFGIRANYKARFLTPVKPIIRYIKKQLKQNNLPTINKQLVRNTNTIADKFHDRVGINEIEMVKSLEESLRALKTDYLDYFLIHEPLNSIENIDEICNVAYKLKLAGKIRAFGIAFMHQQENLHSNYLDRFDLLQFNTSHNANEYNYVVTKYSMSPNIIFSPFKGGANNILSPKEKLIKITNDFTHSIILCSMFNEKHIVDNTSLFQ